MRTRISVGVVAIVAAVGAWVWAQAPDAVVGAGQAVTVAWDHDGVDMDAGGTYVVKVDGVTRVTVPYVAAQTTYTAPLGTFPRGSYALIVEACNAIGCAAAPTFRVRAIGPPTAPTGVRVP